MNNPDHPTKDFKSGFITITGAPNAGKSTLLNHLLGEKISITSKKPQTTRNRILGVVHRPAAQLIFLDTPGVHKPKDPLSIRMVDAAVAAISDGDLVLVIADVSKPLPDSEAYMLQQLEPVKKPVLLALNKIDLIQKNQVLMFIDQWSKAYPFKAIIPISAKHDIQVDELLSQMEALLPQGPQFFPEETLTDVPERFIVAEMIREKVFRLTGQEVPYSTAVTIDQFSEEKNGALIKIHATIHLERDSQKGIVIGKNGSKLKNIGEDARKDIEKLLGTKVFLKLFVRIQKNWSKDTKALRKFGYS
jgi:GTP-binding protein Era